MNESFEKISSPEIFQYALEIQNLGIERNNKILFNNFSHSFETSFIHGIVGPSGSGKTSLLQAIAHLLPIQKGKIFRDEALSYVFQEPRLLPWLSVEKNLALIIENIYKDKNLIREKVFLMLEKVHLQDYAKRYPKELSGGEKQRLALARAFLFPSPLLLMDEAFQSQDIALKLELMDLLEHLHREDKRTIIFVSHDIREALSLSQSLIVLHGSPIQKEIIFSPSKTQKDTTRENKKASEIYVDFPKKFQEIENKILTLFSKKL